MIKQPCVVLWLLACVCSIASASLCPPMDYRELLAHSHAAVLAQPSLLMTKRTHQLGGLFEEALFTPAEPNSSRQADEDAAATDAAAPPATISIAQPPPAPTASPEPQLQSAGRTLQAGAPEPSTAPPASNARLPHKPLWPDITGRDIGMFVVAGVVLFIAAGAGVGGGPVLVPNYLLLGMFSNTAAVALSNITICGGSIANVLCTVHKRHPFKDRSLVDWDLLLLMEPPTIIGAVAGSYINKITPAWISHVLLAMLLTVLTARATQRAKLIYKRESAHVHSESSAHAESHSTSVHGSCHDTQTEDQLRQQEHQHQSQHTQPAAEQQPEQVVRKPSSLAEELCISKEGSKHPTGEPGSCPGAEQQQQQQEPQQEPDAASSGHKASAEAHQPLAHDTSVTVARGAAPSSVLLNIQPDGRRSLGDGGPASPPNPDEAKLAYAPPTKPKRRDSFDTSPHSADGAEGSSAGAAPVPAPEVAACGATEAAVLAKVLREERQRFPLLQLCLALAMFVFTLLTSLFSKTAAQCGSWQAWTIQVALVPSLLAICWYMRSHLLWKAKIKADAQVDTSGELHWNTRNTLIFPAICTFAGVMAGMFGLGGAVVMTPMMLELNVHPQVTAATMNPMLLLTTAAATVTYAAMGDIPWTYAAVLVSIAFVMSLAGQILIDRIVKRVGRSSVLVIILACFFTVATILSYYIVVQAIVDITNKPALLTASSGICSS